MKKIYLIISLLTLLLNGLSLYAQDSYSSKIDSTLKRGFYKTYQEFLDKTPTILLNFSTKLFTGSKEDQIIVRAEYTISDSSDIFGDFWGFCDGKNIFVACGGFFELKYWKLQCEGPNPYFYYKKSVLFPGSEGVGASTIIPTLPSSYVLMFIDKNGRPQETTKFRMKQLIKDNKQLLKEYKAELYTTGELELKYILRYNASKTGK